MRRSSVVIADRHPVVLQGLTNLLGPESDFNIVARCSDGVACIEVVRKLVPDIAIIDVSLPGVSGPEILSIVNSEKLSTHVVFFSVSVDDADGPRAPDYEAGVGGIVEQGNWPAVEHYRRHDQSSSSSHLPEARYQ